MGSSARSLCESGVAAFKKVGATTITTVLSAQKLCRISVETTRQAAAVPRLVIHEA